MIPKISSISFTQEADDCSESGEQLIFIETRDAGAGDYYYLTTEGWAFDNIQEMIDLLTKVKDMMEIEDQDDLSKIIHPSLEGTIDPFGITIPDSVPFPVYPNGTGGSNVTITPGIPPNPPLGVKFQTAGDSDWGTLQLEGTTREPSDIELKEEVASKEDKKFHPGIMDLMESEEYKAEVEVASKSLFHGAKVMIDYMGSTGEGKISISKAGKYYVCSDLPILAGHNCEDKFEYEYSWIISDLEFDNDGVYKYGSMRLELQH